MSVRKKLVAVLLAIALLLSSVALFLLLSNGTRAKAVSNDRLSIEAITDSSDVMKNGYLDRYGVPTAKFTYTNNGEAQDGAPLSNAFDRNFGSIWRSKSADPETLTNNVEVVFEAPVCLDRIVYQADASWWNRGCFTKVRLSYVPSSFNGGTVSESDYQVITELSYPQTSDTNPLLLTFLKDSKAEPIEMKAIKIEWVDVHRGHLHCAAASEIIFLEPESKDVEAVQNLFTDYAQLQLRSDITSLRQIEDLRNAVKKYSTYDTELSYLLNRAEQVFNQTCVYEPRREMKTDPNAENVLLRRGDIAGYARSTLKFAWFGTNRQVTGISVAPGEELVVYVDGNPNDPLPTLSYTQFWGSWSSWKSGEYKLRLGKNVIRPVSYLKDGFTTNDGDALPAGGPVYLSNPYTDKTQSSNVKVYIEGGTLIPVYHMGGDKGQYLQLLADYAQTVKADRADAFDEVLQTRTRDYRVVDVTELVSDNIIITVRATRADEVYNQGIQNRDGTVTYYDPETAMRGWDDYVKELLRSDGVIIEKERDNECGGRYDERAKWLNCNIRLMQPYGAAYAYTEHVGIQVSWEGGALSGSSFGWGYTHELGHMMDIGERTVSECSNNMLSKYDETVMSKIATRGDFAKTTQVLSADDLPASYWNTNRGNFIIWWLIESFHIDYWRTLENLYRYEDVYGGLTAEERALGNMNATEKQVYLSSLALHFDISYYFERWGYNLSGNDPVFVAKDASPVFKLLMQKAKAAGRIQNEGYQPKIWYLDAAEWWARKNDAEVKTSIYTESDVPVLQSVTRSAKGYNLLMNISKEQEASHLGFEIREGGKVIGFTYDRVYLDERSYPQNYEPSYTVVAYDRALTHSAKSNTISPAKEASFCKNSVTNKVYGNLFDAIAELRGNEEIVLLQDGAVSGVSIPADKTVAIRAEKACTLTRGGTEPLFTVEWVQERSGEGDDARVVEKHGTLKLIGTKEAPITLDGMSFEQSAPLVEVNGAFEAEYCTFKNNYIRRTLSVYGGAISAAKGRPSVKASHCTFQNNRSRSGGAIYLGTQSSQTAHELTDCTFHENCASQGGAVYLANVALKLGGCRFEGNIADMGGASNFNEPARGGAIAVRSGGVLTVDTSDDTSETTFENNTAEEGGGIYADGGLIFKASVVFTKNTASTEGAAICYRRSVGSGRTLEIAAMKVENNVCETGAAVYLYGAAQKLTADFGKNEGCLYQADFRNGTFVLSGGKMTGNIFLGNEATLKASGSLPAFSAVVVYTDIEDENGVFLTATDFDIPSSGGEGLSTSESGKIVLGEGNKTLVFALDTVTVTFRCGEQSESFEFLPGRTFTLWSLASGIEIDETMYAAKWISEGDRTEYLPEDEIVLKTPMTFVAELAQKKVVTLRFEESETPENVTLYFIPGETYTLPKYADIEKYDHKGWDLGEKTYQPLSTVTVTDDMTFIAKLVKKLEVRYYISPKTEARSARAAEPLLIATRYFSFGQNIAFVDLDDGAGYNIADYIPEGFAIETYVIRGTEEQIDFSTYLVKSDLVLDALVREAPVYVGGTFYADNVGTGHAAEFFDPIFDVVPYGSSYTVSGIVAPYGYKIVKITCHFLGGDFKEVDIPIDEIEHYQIEEVRNDLFFLVNLELLQYDVVYQYNGTKEFKREKHYYKDEITLDKEKILPEDFPINYHFTSFQLGKTVLELNEEGIYEEQEVTLFAIEGQVIPVTEDLVIDVVASVEPMQLHEAKEPNCTEGGNLAYYTYGDCPDFFKDLYGEEKYGGWEEIELSSVPGKHVYHWVEEIAATCLSAGTKGHFHCAACEKDFTADKTETTDLTLEALGHSMKKVEETPATETAEGMKEHYECEHEPGVYYRDEEGTSVYAAEELVIPKLPSASGGGSGGSGDGGSPKIGMIVGIAAGGCVLVGVGIFLFVFRKRRS